MGNGSGVRVEWGGEWEWCEGGVWWEWEGVRVGWGMGGV